MARFRRLPLDRLTIQRFVNVFHSFRFAPHSCRSPLFPVLLFLFAFFVVPLFLVFGMSFSTRGTYGKVEWTFTFLNYIRLFDALYLTIYLRSMAMALATTLICLILGFPMAYWIARASSRWRTIVLVLVMIPFWTNFLVRTYAWLFLLRADGVINTALTMGGFTSHPLKLLYTDGAVLVGLVYGYLPFMILPLVVAIERIPLSLEEAARDLYAGSWSVLGRVIIPLARPGIIAGSLLVFIPSLGAFITPYLLGGGQSMMLGTFIQQEFLVVRDWPFGAATSFVLMSLVLVILFGLGKHLDLVHRG